MITTIQNQSLLDIAIQEDGNVLAAFDWALKNGISLTDELLPGQKLEHPTSENRNNDVAQYFKGSQQYIATGYVDQEEIENISVGIGEMIIETSFIVQ